MPPLSSLQLLRNTPRLGQAAILKPTARVASTLSSTAGGRTPLESILIANRGEIAL